MGVVESYGGVFIWFAMALLVVVAWRRSKTRRGRKPQRIGSIGPGAAGAFYEMLSDDRRKAIEIILEEKAGYHDPEDADGNLPDLEDPRAPHREKNVGRELPDRRSLGEGGSPRRSS
jgi:hypothetical protein